MLEYEYQNIGYTFMANDRINNLLYAVTPKHKKYEIAVNDYKDWLNSPEGSSATDEQKRLKRRQLFSATNSEANPEEEALNKRVNLLGSPQADAFRRVYEATRRERPELNPYWAYQLALANNPDLISGISPQQVTDLYNRYVRHDTRERGDSEGIPNTLYDSVLYDKDRSMLNKMMNTGAANFVTNFANPVLQGATTPLSLGSSMIAGGLMTGVRGYNWLSGQRAPAASWAVQAARALEQAPEYLTKGINKLAPTKTAYADSDLGYTGLDKFNQATNTASHLGGIALGFGGNLSAPASSALPLPTTLLRHPIKHIKSLGPSSKAVRRILHPVRTLETMRRAGHPIRSLFGAGKGSLGKTLGSADTLLGNYYGLTHTAGQLGQLVTPNTSDYLGDRSTVSELYGPKTAMLRDSTGAVDSRAVSTEPEDGFTEIYNNPAYVLYSRTSPKNRGLNKAIRNRRPGSEHGQAQVRSYVDSHRQLSDAISGGTPTYTLTGMGDMRKTTPKDLQFLVANK